MDPSGTPAIDADLRILVVAPDPSAADGIASTLRRDLGPRTTIVRARRVPDDTARFDAAVVLGPDVTLAVEHLNGTPVVVLADDGGQGDCSALARLGAHQELPRACATCAHEPCLAAALRWAIERGHLVRELERARERDARMALLDPLTGLPNLRLLRERMRVLVAQGRRSGKGLAVLLVDLDGFKRVNDTWGHAAGDRLLREVARRMSACVRETDTVARRGGDEFVVLLDGVHQREDAACVAQKILRSISEPLVVLGTVLHVTASIGLALYPEEGTRGEILERNADRAMYRAKESGRNGFCFPDGELCAPGTSRG